MAGMQRAKKPKKRTKLISNNIKIHEPETQGDVQRYTKEFAKLQSEWYGKLKETGFNDLEYVGYARTDASCAPLKSSTAPDQNLGERSIQAHYYNLLQNYLTHNANRGNFRERVIFRLYAQGVSYRKIAEHSTVLKLIKQGKLKPFSYFIVFQVVQKWKELALAWNKTHPEGLEFKDVLDAAEDAEGGEA